jgi:hypothetical protein
MTKIGAAALLVLAALAKSVSAEANGDCGNEGAQCLGNPDMDVMCCEQFVCIQKDEFYGQCLPPEAEVPEEWDGFEVTEMSPMEADADADAPMDAEADAPMMMDAETPRMIVPGEDRYIAVIAKDYIPYDAKNVTLPKNLVNITVCIFSASACTERAAYLIVPCCLQQSDTQRVSAAG